MISGAETFGFAWQKIFLRRFSKILCLLTLFLILAGGQVTSTGSGLSVPDWPLSYGMVFPPMVGGVFYEHGHRMIATLVGFLTLCLAILLGLWEKRRWVKILGFVGLGAVILQGILGGITVLFFLPLAVSVSHAILAQTFFLITILLAYSQSQERGQRSVAGEYRNTPQLLKWIIFWILLIYVQLALGALMRHAKAGLAIPDFPTMGNQWIPLFNEKMLQMINDWRFENNYDSVTMFQIVVHFLHRLAALVLFSALLALNSMAVKNIAGDIKNLQTLLTLDALFFLQIILGISTILTLKSPLVASLHVMLGAGILGWSTLFLLRTAPLSLSEFKKQIFS